MAQMSGQRADGGAMGMLLLSHDEAEALAQQLLARAGEIRRLRAGGREGEGIVRVRPPS